MDVKPNEGIQFVNRSKIWIKRVMEIVELESDEEALVKLILLIHKKKKKIMKMIFIIQEEL